MPKSYAVPNINTIDNIRLRKILTDFSGGLNLKAFPTELKDNEAQVLNDAWWRKDQNNCQLITNSGYLVINEGEALGKVLGANLCTLNLLQGTEFMPDLNGAVLFIEDDELTFPAEFDRDLQSLIHLPSFKGIKGLVIGRFQKASKVSSDLLKQIIKSKKELNGIPVIAGVDFGHTDPKITFPIGGEVQIDANDGKTEINFTRH